MIHLSEQKKNLKVYRKANFVSQVPLCVQFYSLYISVNDFYNQIRYMNLPSFQKFVDLKFSANNLFRSHVF